MEPANSAGPAGAASYLADDTIAAIATALGGPIAILRVSGPRASRLLDGVTRPGQAAALVARRLTLVSVRDPGGAAIDQALAVRFEAPDSFTGEDLVELHTHGGAYIASRALEALISAGARQALPGEFSFRAVRNGKLSLGQAEATADLIAASNDGALALALEKLSGSQTRWIGELAEELRALVALGEAGIDFSDQDLAEIQLPRLREKLRGPSARLRELRDSYRRGSHIQEGVATVFLGAPNAGKSTLFNVLLGESRSIVSPVPGTTRDVLREKLTLRGERTSVTLRLHDTAGLGESSADEIEQVGMGRSREAARDAELVLFLVDASSKDSLAVAQRQWALLCEELGPSLAERTLGVLTKTDLVLSGDLGPTKTDLVPFGLARWVSCSAVTGEGIASVIAEITSFCERWLFRKSGEVLLTRLDHHRAAASALEHLERASCAPELDLFAADLRHALTSLAPLIGDTLPDDILGRIFSQFCVGK